MTPDQLRDAVVSKAKEIWDDPEKIREYCAATGSVLSVERGFGFGSGLKRAVLETVANNVVQGYRWRVFDVLGGDPQFAIIDRIEEPTHYTELTDFPYV